MTCHDDVATPSPTTAGASCFGHPVGHQCAACDALRRTGPQGLRNPLARLIAASTDTPTPETPANARARMGERQRTATRQLAARHKARLALAKRYSLATLEAAIVARYGAVPA